MASGIASSFGAQYYRAYQPKGLQLVYAHGNTPHYKQHTVGEETSLKRFKFRASDNLRVSYDDYVNARMTDVHAEQPSVNALSEH